MPFFSIVIPVYNLEEYIKPCLESILNQSFSDYEVIVVDDGSTDSSVSIIKSYADSGKVRLVVLENGGVSRARNVGLRLARGEYVWFVDGDDYIDRDALSVLYTLVQKGRPDTILMGCYRDVESKVMKIYSPPCIKGLTDGKGVLSYMLDKGFYTVAICLYMFRRDFLLEKNLFFVESIKYEDELFVPEAFYNAQHIVLCPECLYYYRRRSGSATTQNIKMIHVDNLIYVSLVLYDRFRDRKDLWDKIKKHIFILYIRASKLAVKGGFFKDFTDKYNKQEYADRLRSLRSSRRQRLECYLFEKHVYLYKCYVHSLVHLHQFFTRNCI